MKPCSALLVAFIAVAQLSAQKPDDNLPDPKLTEYWTPVPAVVSVPVGGVPSDAVVLFDGSSTAAWAPQKADKAVWPVVDGALVVAPKTTSIQTKQAFGDVQLHLEFRTPAVVKGESQARGNSGVFFMGLYELQILDSWNNATYVNGQAGSVYKQHPPLVNASRGPGEWQVYDAVFVAPRFAADGTLVSPARMTVFHNGVLVQHDVVLRGPTVYRGEPKYASHAAKLPIMLQDHNNPTAFRNIWVREIKLP
jgi:hypothetical protein